MVEYEVPDKYDRKLIAFCILKYIGIKKYITERCINYIAEQILEASEKAMCSNSNIAYLFIIPPKAYKRGYFVRICIRKNRRSVLSLPGMFSIKYTLEKYTWWSGPITIRLEWCRT